jgi:cell division protein FtsN
MSKHNNKQAGGTLLGVVIGLIIGLSIAVVVAITIKNTPLPFTNKNKHDKVAGPTADQMADINKPLYGSKEAAKQASREFIKIPGEDAAAVKPADQKVAKADPKTAAAAVVKIDNKATSADKALVEKTVAEKLAAEKAKPAEDKYTYYLQAGAFRELNDAENTKARLALLGLGASISEKESENGMLYRVRVGPFSELEAMNRTKGKLSDNGVDVAIVRLPR